MRCEKSVDGDALAAEYLLRLADRKHLRESVERCRRARLAQQVPDWVERPDLYIDALDELTAAGVE